jgi:hypothetical protein
LSDASWQELERSWRAASGDQDLLERAITARRRVGVAAPWDMLRARRRRPRAFTSELRFNVWVELPEGEVDLVGQTGPGPRSVTVPAHRSWWVSPAASSDMDAVAAELRRGQVPGFSFPSRTQLNHEALVPLSEVPSLERLAFLQCRGLSAATLAPLRDVAHLADLSLVYCGLGDPATLELIGSLTSLVELNLAGAPVDDRGVACLTGLRELAALNLSSAALTDEGLASLGALRELRDLRLQGSSVSSQGLRALQAATHLQVLHLDASELGGEALATLAGWGELRELGLERCVSLGPDAWEHVRAASGLRELSLDGAPSLDDRAFAHVAALPLLEDLVVSGATIGAASLRALAGRPLRSLILSDCQGLGAGTVEALSGLRGLRTLSLDACPLTWEDVEQVRRALPACQVEWTEAL